MAETYRDQWQSAAAALRSHAAKFDELANLAPARPPGPLTDEERETIESIVRGVERGIWRPTPAMKKFVAAMLQRLLLNQEVASNG